MDHIGSSLRPVGDLLAARIVTLDHFMADDYALPRNGERSVSPKPIPVLLMPGETVWQYEAKFQRWLLNRRVSCELLQCEPVVERRYRLDFADSKAWKLRRRSIGAASSLTSAPPSRERQQSRGIRGRNELLSSEVMTVDKFEAEVEKFGPNGYLGNGSRLKNIPIVLKPGESKRLYEVDFQQWLGKKQMKLEMLRDDPEEERRYRQCFAYARVITARFHAKPLKSSRRWTRSRSRSTSSSRGSEDSRGGGRHSSRSQCRSRHRSRSRSSSSSRSRSRSWSCCSCSSRSSSVSCESCKPPRRYLKREASVQLDRSSSYRSRKIPRQESEDVHEAFVPPSKDHGRVTRSTNVPAVFTPVDYESAMSDANDADDKTHPSLLQYNPEQAGSTSVTARPDAVECCNINEDSVERVHGVDCTDSPSMHHQSWRGSRDVRHHDTDELSHLHSPSLHVKKNIEDGPKPVMEEMSYASVYRAATETLERSTQLNIDLADLVEKYKIVVERIALNEGVVMDSLNSIIPRATTTGSASETQEHLSQIKELVVCISREKQQRDAILAAIFAREFQEKHEDLDLHSRQATLSCAIHETLVSLYGKLEKNTDLARALQVKLKNRLRWLEEDSTIRDARVDEIQEITSALDAALVDRSRLLGLRKSLLVELLRLDSGVAMLTTVMVEEGRQSRKN